MSERRLPDSSEFNKWLVERLRLTIFPKDKTVFAHSGWKDLLQEEPEQKIDSPREGKIVEYGSWGNGNLYFESSLGRRDWHWDAIFNPNETIPNIDPFIDASQSFIDLMDKSLENSPDVDRIAFGGVFHLPVIDKGEGYGKIAKYLPYIELDPNSSDFYYSINRPRPANEKIKGLQINRLSKWSVSSIKQLRLGADGRSIEPSTNLSAIRLELDINTVPDDNISFLSNNQSEIFHELFGLGKEIIEKGDIK